MNTPIEGAVPDALNALYPDFTTAFKILIFLILMVNGCFCKKILYLIKNLLPTVWCLAMYFRTGVFPKISSPITKFNKMGLFSFFKSHVAQIATMLLLLYNIFPRYFYPKHLTLYSIPIFPLIISLINSSSGFIFILWTFNILDHLYCPYINFIVFTL